MNQVAAANRKISVLSQTYFDAIGRNLNNIVAQEMRNMLLNDIPSEYIEFALTQAAGAPRPSWIYAKAIIRRLERERPDPLTLILADW